LFLFFFPIFPNKIYKNILLYIEKRMMRKLI